MKFKRILIFTLLFTMICSLNISADTATNYTYNYNFWGEEVPSPDAYYVSKVFTGSDIGVGVFKDPQGMFINKNIIYVCDSGNNRIVSVRYTEDGNYEVLKVVTSVDINGEESNFNYPMDIFETDDGEFYIADTNNFRILKLDKDFNFIQQINKPNDQSISDISEFLPCKLVSDFTGRLYVQARNVNKGLLEFDKFGEFTGYLGANKVQINIIDYVWKNYLSTEAQRNQMELFVPTEYNNVAIDSDGFIYTTTSTFNENLIESADPVRRLNAMGTDILVRNGWVAPIGDWHWGSAGGINGSSRFSDVVGLENDSYVCLDRIRGRLFAYDFQGNFLYAFGGNGNRDGYFNNPIAIDSMGFSLFVLDSRNASVTRFDLTEYGQSIRDAMGLYKLGQYDESSDKWDAVLKFNGNYDLAYIGKARAELRNGNYLEAMNYYKIKNDVENYGKAFTLYRKQWMEENIVNLLIIFVVAVILISVLRKLWSARKSRKAGGNNE